MVTNGIALAAHFGDGVLRPADVAAGIVGAVVQDPVSDGVVWREYLETVVREREGWRDFYRAAREPEHADLPLLLGVRHHGPGSARAVRRALDAYRPRSCSSKGRRRPTAWWGWRPRRRCGRRWRCSRTAAAHRVQHQPNSDGGRRRTAAYWPFAEFSPEWQAIQWAMAHGVPVRFCDLPTTFRLALR